MDRLLLLVLTIGGIGIAFLRPAADTGPAVVPPVQAASVASTAPASTVAYRPGEPMLVPGASVELQRAADGHFYADMTVNGQPLRMLVDTGASAVALSMADAQRLGMAVDPARLRVVGSGASGPVRGLPVTLDRVAVGPLGGGPVAAVVVEGLDRSLLGQAWLGQHDLQVSGDRMTLR